MKSALNGEIVIERLRIQIANEKIDLKKLFSEWTSKCPHIVGFQSNSWDNHITKTALRELFLECGVFVHKEEVSPLM